jgi:ABC-type sugar transport system, periplasmic component
MKNGAKKVFLLITVCVFMFTSVVWGASKQPAKKIRIGFSISDISNPTWVEMYKLMQQKAKKLNAELILNDAKLDPNSQVNALENFIASKCDAIIVHAFDKQASIPTINKAMAAGIKVVAYDIKIDKYDSSLTVDNYKFGYAVGEEAAKWINTKNHGTAEVGIISYPLLPILVERVTGIKDAIKKSAPDAKVVQEVAASDAASSVKAGEDLLQAHPNIKVIAATAGMFALGATEAVKSQNKVGDDFGIFTCDANTDVLNAIKEGTVLRTGVYTDVLVKGPEMVDTAVKLVKGQPVPKDIYFAMDAVTKKNVDKYLKIAVK